MPAPKEIVDLVERFQRNQEEYESGKYNETQLRREFLDPFFKALGWDVTNEKGYSEAYKEVIHEDAIKIGAATKAPDYCFRIGGTRKFFLEAKKPSVNIKEDLSPAFQLRRYAWSAKLPLSILSDFAEFAVYDCRVKPYKTDKATTARILYFTFDQYIDKWDEIASVFSQDAVLKGSFDKYAESGKNKKGTSTVDEAFLEEIENWRRELAKNIATRNSKLSVQELNFSVQKIIDRIIFLRICEDRGIEQYGKLLSLTNGTKVYDRLTQVFQRADERFNSGLFHFQKEKDRPEQPDELTLDLKIDDKIFKDMIGGLYYPESPYEFSALPADILGQVYEQFLGKVIRLTDGHQAKVEDKPEVKKAGGVFYTPTYIVEYIVKNTVGKLCEGKTPKQVSKLRILDPACGSGSFLIGAYQYLLDWHQDWYIKDGPQNYPKELYQAPGGDWRLTTETRRKILLNNIYGVDIDPQAVEVTKLSLLLKVLEGASDQTLKKQLEIFHQRALPDLGSNIKCGNSLIDSEYFTNQLLHDPNELRRVNPFDWKMEFSGAVTTKGFDAVIGNPPYIRIQTMKEWAPLEVEIYKENYSSAASGNYDIYVVFVEKGLKLLSETGLLGFILPSKFITTDYGENLRKLITNKKALIQLIDFGSVQVFQRASTYTCLLFLSGAVQENVIYSEIVTPKEISTNEIKFQKISSLSFTEKSWSFKNEDEKIIEEKLLKNSTELRNLPSRIGRGSSSGMDDVFVIESKDRKFVSRKNEALDIEPEILKTPIYATDFGRYRFSIKNNEKIIFPYEVNETSYRLLDEKEIASKYPKAYKYLLQNKKDLMSRKQFSKWYGFSAPRNLDVHSKAQMLVPLLAEIGSFCRLSEESSNYCLMASGGFSITIDAQCNLLPEYVLGLLNSKLIFWRLRSISNIFRGGWITCTKQYVETLPIKNIDFKSKEEKKQHDFIVEAVKNILELNLKRQISKNPNDLSVIDRQLKIAEKNIDNTVYELFGLSESERTLVEGLKNR